MGKLLRRIQYWIRNRQREAALSEELQVHRAMKQDRLERSGMCTTEAAYASRRALGNQTLAREDARAVWVWPRLEGVWKDVCFGARALRRNPGFTAVAVFTVALGIGATTAIFSVVQAVVLRPLPFADPNRLAMLWMDDAKRGLHEKPTSYLMFADWRRQSARFSDMAIFSGNPAVLVGTDVPERTLTAFVSANLFPLLGVAPVLGRTFSQEEEAGAESVAVVSFTMWQRRFGGSPDVIGKTVDIDGDMNAYKKGPRTVRIVGVMPAGFYFPTKTTQLWEPATVYWRWKAESTDRFSEWARRWGVVARLERSASVRDAQAEMATIGQRLSQAYPASDPDFPGFAVNVVPILDQFVGNKFQLALWVLLGAVGCVLLIACANVANLLLARGATRGRELAIRTALGAGRARLTRQLLIESVLLSTIGGLVGLWLASAGVRLMSASALPGIPRLEEIRIDSSVLAFTAVLSVLAGIIFGIVPAWKLSRSDPNDALKEGSLSASDGARLRRSRGLLIVVECALAVVLLIGSGLLIRSFLRLQAVDPGFDPDRVLVVRVALAPGLRPPVKPARGDSGAAMYATREDLFTRITDRLSSIKGVRAVGAITDFLIPGAADDFVTIEGHAESAAGQDAGQLASADVNPTFFQTMGVPLVRGRFFTRADALQKIRLFFPASTRSRSVPRPRPGAEAAIVNEAFVRRYFPAEDAIGKRFFIGQLANKPYWFEIVGIVRDMRRQGLEQQAVPQWYGQLIGGTTDLVVRMDREPLALAGTIGDAIRSVDPHVMVLSMATAEDRMGILTAPRRFQTWLLTLFAAIALTLSAVGIYGIVRYGVAQRTREIGVRMALGAGRREVVRLILSEGMRLPLVGLALGLGSALVLTRVLDHMLFEVTATDATTFVGIAAVLTGVTLLACYLPARKAARVDPIVALRYE